MMAPPLQRAVSGAVVAAIFAAVIVFGTGHVVAVLAALLTVALAYEWSRLTEMGAAARQMPQIVLTAALMLAIYTMPRWLPWVLTAAAIWWVLAFVLILGHDQIRRDAAQYMYWTFRIGMPLALSVAWASLVLLHERNYWWLLYCVALVSCSDIGAYYIGRRFGKTPLFAQLSPGKTRAGLWGGIAASLVLCLLVAFTVSRTWVDMAYLILLSVCVVQVGVVGDLFVSLMKRYAGVKDTGALLPGHGGILDRADSLLPSLPLFFAAMYG